MRRLTLLLVSLVLLSIQSVLAQSFSVKGTVVSAEDKRTDDWCDHYARGNIKWRYDRY